MTNEFANVERRVAALEHSARRWRMTAVLCATLSVVLVAAGFRVSRPQQAVDAERITLHRSSAVGARFGNQSVELSVGLDGGLQMQFSADSVPRGRLVPSAELRLIDATGHEVARLGPMKASQLAK